MVEVFEKVFEKLQFRTPSYVELGNVRYIKTSLHTK
jgi:hypothetical protein